MPSHLPRGAALAVAWAICLLAIAAPPQAKKVPQPDVQAKRGELDELKGRIDALRKEVAKAEESRADVADQLEETERAISQANRRLRELTEQRLESQRGLAALEAEAKRIEADVAVQQTRLARLLRNRYTSGEADSLQHLIQGRDPNQTARDGLYLARLSRAQAELIADLRRSLEQKRAVAQRVQDKNAELAGIEQDHKKERSELVAQQDKRRSVLDGIAGQIKARRREIESLKRDEKRLARLIDGLSRIVKRTPRPAGRPGTSMVAAPTAAASPAMEPAPALPAGPTVSPAPMPARTDDPPAPAALAHNDQTPDESLAGRAFARLRGQLRLPARGELINRFGAPRHDGGTTWKGVFIRATQGSEVRAIASGRVVFADWLRGFGNLVILDHGESYLSVYGSNESVFKGVGQAVRAGDVIATVGNSGGNAESGLYFELRHQGQPLDPMKWVNLR